MHLHRYYRVLLFSILVFSGISCKKNYQVQLSQAKYLEVSALAPDSATNVLIMPYKKILDVEMLKIIGQNEQELPKVRRGRELLLANFITDLMMEASDRYSKQKTDISMITFGGLRAGLPKGAIKTVDVFELMPFENELII
jgi:2',3'-cyclic-nucleotide 2'-phosphodiesterase (5'-nucleotidase family)